MKSQRGREGCPGYQVLIRVDDDKLLVQTDSPFAGGFDGITPPLYLNTGLNVVVCKLSKGISRGSSEKWGRIDSRFEKADITGSQGASLFR